jgi:transposase-like protein
MSFFERLKTEASAEWRAYTEHPFATGMPDGTLTEPAFRHYLVQDYLFFLIEFARAYALAVYKSLQLADTLLAFDDFPAEHWKHLPTTNPIESTFATVRHRTIRSKGCLSNKTALAMVFKLVEGAQKSWRRLDGHNSCRR